VQSGVRRLQAAGAVQKYRTVSARDVLASLLVRAGSHELVSAPA